MKSGDTVKSKHFSVTFTGNTSEVAVPYWEFLNAIKRQFTQTSLRKLIKDLEIK